MEFLGVWSTQISFAYAPININTQYRYAAVLNLNKYYDNVPRQNLKRLLQSHLPGRKAVQLLSYLTSMVLCTRGQRYS